MEKSVKVIKNKCGAAFQKKYLALWIFALVQLVYHIMMHEPEGSDAMWFFRNQLAAFSLRDYLSMRYHTWTSRLVIEGVLVYIAQNITLWKILDYIVWIFLVWALTGLFPKEKRETAGIIIVGIFLIYPIWDLRSAGWIATTLNYTWPLAFGAFALHGTANAFYGKRTPVWLGALYALAAVYGANMEQMCAVLLGVNSLAILWFIYEKKSWKTYWQVLLCWLIAAAEFIFIMTCPGNEARKIKETISWFPHYESLNIIDKACMGLLDTIRYLLTSGNLMFLAFTVFLAVLVFLKSKNVFHRSAAVFPAAINVMCVFFRDMLKRQFPIFEKQLKESAYIDGRNYYKAENYIMTIVAFLIIGCLLVSVIVICDSVFELVSQLVLLALALATRVIMGFTPTIYVSQERTFLFLYVLLGISAAWFAVENEELLKKNEKQYSALKTAGVCLAVWSVLMALVEVGRML